MKARKLLLLTVLWSVLSLQSSSQSIIGRQKVDQFPITWWGTTCHGLTWLPPTYTVDTTKRYPLILFLHGLGETGDGVGGLWGLLNTALPQTIANGWDPQAVNPVDGLTYEFIVVSPQAPSATGWSLQWNSLQYVVPDIINRYRIDTSRIYVTGLSAGGNATWTCLTSGPSAAKRFAAAVTMASAPQALDSISLVGSQYGVKLWQICGDGDAFYNFSVTSNATYDGGSPTPVPQATLTNFPGQGHWASVWNTGYDPNWTANVHNKNIYQWMLQYKRTFTTATLTANAGSNQTITLPTNQTTLNGSGTPPTGDTISSYLWTKISGPSGDLIATPNAASTQINSLVQGTYTYKLKVTSSINDTATATVLVTVNTPPNQLPLVNAGSNAGIQLPVDSVTLNGTATDSDGTIVSKQWTKISGPSTYTIVSATQLQTVVDNLVQGVYLFELSATDNDGAVVKDTVQITVNAAPPNQLPIVNGGSDVIIQLPVDSVTLNGSASDNDGTIVSTQWTKISGPSAYTIVNATQLQTVVDNLTQGAYQFELSATDNDGAVVKDTVQITVNAAPPNQLPVVNAGSDLTIQLPVDSVILNGTATDNDGTIVSKQWTKISGPSAYTIVSATQLQTVVDNLVQGVYQFELSATDNDGATVKDTIQITVLAAASANLPPSATAGVDTTITLPVDSIHLSGSGMDSDGVITSYKWKKIAGPSQFVIADTAQAQTLVDSLVAGIYKFELSVTDDSSAVAKDTVTITVLSSANLPPVANAGSDTTITLPVDSVVVSGTGSDADGNIISYQWTKISGPSQYSVVDADSAQTVIGSLVQGIYQFELKVLDNDSSFAKDTLTITVNPPSTACNGVKRYMMPGGDGGKTISADTASWWHLQVNPGDTLVLKSQDAWNYFRMDNYSGTASCPIVIINEGGQVWMTGGINAENCVNLKITGSGAANTYYGFKVYSPVFDGFSVAIGIQGRSKNVEVERIDVLHKGYGVWAKQDPLCDTSYNYPNYVMDNINIHHSRFKKIWQDCIYAGNTDPLGERITWCNGVETHPIPMRLSNINIHHLIIDSCGRTGIQISGADAGINRIHDNVVTNCGYEYNQWQGTGITIGSVSRNCYVYNNVVRNTFIYGIFDLGADSSFIYNNIVDSSGFLPIDPTVDINAIAASTNTTALPGNWLKNTMALPGSIQASTKNTIPHFTKTVFYKNNKLGKNATTVDPNGIIQIGWWGPAQDWTTNNQICGNTRLDGVTPAKVDPFWYTPLNQYWPEYDSTCSVAIPNMPPTANAGVDTVLVPPADSVMLLGSGTDADGTIISYHWEKISGPSQFTIASADSAHTLLSNLSSGIYMFRLTVMDNDSLTATDEVEISVAPSNALPIANAGNNKVITLPVTATTLNGSGIDPDGSQLTYLWTKISGPSTFTVGDTTQPVTTLTNLVPGEYWFELLVTDTSGGIDKDTMIVNVNIAPTVYAGPDQIIQLPVNTVSVTATAADVDGTLAVYLWKKINGPSAHTFTSAGQLSTNITGLVAGIYEFEITVWDNFYGFDKDTLTITVFPALNTGPIANAGNDISITLPTNSVTLTGSGADQNGTIVGYNWNKISGPASFTIVSPTQAQTNVTGLAVGVYEFELTVTDDSSSTGSDIVRVTVYPALNTAPTANAGADITITLPTNSTTLNGSGTDADGIVASYQWTKINGPVQYTLANSTQAQTALSNLVQGTYYFELRVTDDSSAVDYDTVVVIVNPAPNVPPVANAGPNQTITLPTNSVMLNGIGTDADGTVVSYLWTNVFGPWQYNIINATQSQTQITGLVPGVYIFRLAVTDNSGATSTSDVTITVNPAPNVPPVANAGADISITLPTNNTTLNGSGTDSDGSIVSYQWNMISGPSSFTIASPTAAQTNITGLVQGVYQFELTVTDNSGATATDIVVVTVNPAPNVPPTANAGIDITITLPTNNTTLNGSGTDTDGSIVSYQWNMISGPSSFTIVTPTAAQTNITNLVQGVYQFKLTVTDNNGAVATDTVSVTVNPAPNVPPVATAGPSQTITLPTNSVVLNGTGTDSDGTVVTYLWTQAFGPWQYNISNASQAQTSVTGLVAGTYVFRLTVTDNDGATATSDVTIIVNPAPIVPPVASAGSDITITLPVNSTTLNGSGTDSDGSIISYQWNMIAGPAQYSIASPTSAQTNITNLVQGVYQFELTVTDNSGATATDIVVVTVNPAPIVPPVANAGSDIIITLPVNNPTLNGSGTDADGTIVSYQWNKIAGPSSFVIVAATSAQTNVTGLVQGVYSFELTVTDNVGATAKDTVDVTVNPAPNVPPVAIAGADITITLPVNNTTLNGSGTDSDGTISSYQWTKISGPASFIIANASQAQTAISGLTQGVYQFVLTVTDNSGATATDTVSVTVLSAPNVPPTVDAGPDQTITLPLNSTSVNGVATDVDGTIVSYSWTKVFGPWQHTISNPTQSLTTITGLVQGTYLFELTVTDNSGAVAVDTIQITVLPVPNVPPVANAGSDITITLPVNSTTLNGSGTDTDGTIASYVWTKISGPSQYNIANATQNQTAITNLVQGVYQFELTVTDNSGATATDIVVVTVNPAPNVPPVANAGNDIVITLPVNSTTLNGSGTDSDGTITAYQWNKIAGPSSFNIVSPTIAQTTVNSLVQGVYSFELTVTDNSGATATDTIMVTVAVAPNVPPTVDAGPDQTITLPLNSTTVNGVATDVDGTIVSYSWTKVFGPSQHSIGSPSQSLTQITGLVQGIYRFELTVTDNSGAVAVDTIQITVLPAPNVPPVANAGSDIIITLPVNNTTLNGSATDTDGTITAYQWTKLTGPASFNIVNASQPQTALTGLVQGVYTFELTVTDNSGATDTDTVQVTVNPVPNVPPVANAGADQTLVLPVNATTLSGIGVDVDGTIVSYLWKKINGPSSFAIANAGNAQTNVSTLVQGVYQFELTVTDDDGATGKDSMTVTVNTPPNIPPVAKAGNDVTVYLPIDSAKVTGSATDADGTVVSYQWTKISGPSQHSIVSPTNAVTTFKNLVEGEYQFQLTVTDNNGATGKDTVKVTVVNLARLNVQTMAFPNPFTTTVHVRIVASSQRSQSFIRIYNEAGALVYAEEFMRTAPLVDKHINVSMLKQGAYLVSVGVDINTVKTFKLVK